MSNTTGYRDTNTIESTTVVRDIRPAILEYDKNLTPLLVLTSNIGGGSRGANAPKVEWYEEDREVRRDTSTTTGTGTSLAVTDGTLWKPEEVWKNTRTGEGFRVVSVSTNTVTVVRNLDASGAVACVSGDEYLKVGVAKMEGDTEREAYGGNPTQKFNYMQIFERTYAMTGTAQATGTYTNPEDWYFRAQKTMREFKLDKEAAYLWGPGPGIDTSGAHPRRYMRGIVPSITTNVTDFSGTMTESDFWSAFDTAFRYGSNKKIAIAGRTPISVISAFPRGKLEVIQGSNDTTYGLDILRFQHAHGTLSFMPHNLFSDSTLYAKEVLIVDVAGDGGDSLVQERYLNGNGVNRDTQITEHVEENGRDGRKDKILCETTLTTGLEKAHSRWKNIGA